MYTSQIHGDSSCGARVHFVGCRKTNRGKCPATARCAQSFVSLSANGWQHGVFRVEARAVTEGGSRRRRGAGAVKGFSRAGARARLHCFSFFPFTASPSMRKHTDAQTVMGEGFTGNSFTHAFTTAVGDYDAVAPAFRHFAGGFSWFSPPRVSSGGAVVGRPIAARRRVRGRRFTAVKHFRESLHPKSTIVQRFTA